MDARDLVDTPVRAIRYRLRGDFQSAEGAHSLQVFIPCPPVVDRAKMLPRLTIF